MKERLIIISRLLQANQITVDEAELLLEKEKEYVGYPLPTWTNPGPYMSFVGTPATGGIATPFTFTESTGNLLVTPNGILIKEE